jgi:hypothetical protein
MKGQLSLAFEMKMQLEIIQIDPDGGSRILKYFYPNGPGPLVAPSVM